MSWTKEQYDTMQQKAHELGYHLITPYRKNLNNIRIGVIVPKNEADTPTRTLSKRREHELR